MQLESIFSTGVSKLWSEICFCMDLEQRMVFTFLKNVKGRKEKKYRRKKSSNSHADSMWLQSLDLLDFSAKNEIVF